MPTNKVKLGILGTGMAGKAENAVVKNKRKKKKRLDNIMSSIRSGRKTK